MRTVLVAVVLSSVACSAEEIDYVIDVSAYEPTMPPSPLAITQDTLVFPLARGPVVEAPTRSTPGDLIVGYTRVGCKSPSAEGMLDQDDLDIVAGIPVRLTQVIVEQARVYDALERERPADETCVSHRAADGTWSVPMPPTESTVSGARRTSSFTLDLDDVDAAAVFLPSFATVWRVTYRVER